MTIRNGVHVACAGVLLVSFSQTASAVHGADVAPVTSDLPNSAYSAVGFLTSSSTSNDRACTATLIAPQVVLTAAHCFGAIGQKCQSAGQAIASLSTFVLSANATGSSDRQNFAVDGVVLHPKAYSQTIMATCGANATITCKTEAWPHDFGLHHSHDLALVHLAQPVPTSVATPLQVVTASTNLVPAMSGNPAEPPGNGTGFRTSLIDEPFAGCHFFPPNVVGWGASDTADLARHAGDGRFGPIAACSGEGTPNASSASQFTAGFIATEACDGTTTDVLESDPVMDIVRTPFDGNDHFGGASYATPPTASSAGVFTRDDGAPVLAISTDPSQQPGLPVGAYVLGVVSKGDTTADGDTLASNNRGEALVSPTFTLTSTTKTWGSTNGIWIETRLKDFDGDGVNDDTDNCLTTSNADQQDTNAADEDVLQTTRVGDACDTNGTTALSTFDTSNGESGPCRVCLIGGAGGCSVDPNTTCPEVLSSGLQFDSFIGNTTGDAPAVKGTSAPVFCPCGDANTAGTDLTTLKQCQTKSQCLLAQDKAFPPLDGSPSTFPSGWSVITRQSTVVISKFQIRLDELYTALATTHQERSDVVKYTSMSVPTTWDFRADFPSITSLPGVTWAHVLSPTAIVGADLSNHYRADTFTLTPGTTYRWVPPFHGVWAPWFDHGDPWNQPWVTVIQEGSQLLMLSQSADGSVSDITSHMDPTATSLLTAVASGASDLIIGDDMLPVMPFDSGARPAVIVAAGSLDVQGALTQVGAHIGGVTPQSVIGTADPALLRNYDATDGLLWALHSGSNASLTQVDVTKGLSSLPDVTSIPITGTLPQNALAMTWHKIENALFVADVVTVDLGRRALRLLRIERDGSAGELWRTAPFAFTPDTVYLSASQQNEVVLAVSRDGFTEVVLMDPDSGAPLASTGRHGHLLARAIATNSSVVLPFDRTAHNDKSNLDVQVVDRNALRVGLCAAHWLRDNVDVQLTALGSPKVDCRTDDQQHQHDDD